MKTYIFTLLAAIPCAVAACGPGDGPPVLSDPNGPLTDDEQTLTPQQLLGKRLFEDDALSQPAGTACQSCHDPAKAYSGRPSAVRDTATVAYAAGVPFFVFNTVLNPDGSFAGYQAVGGLEGDGRAASLSDQAVDPFLDPAQMGNTSAAAVVAKVQGGAYATLFRDVNGQESFENVATAYTRLADALAAYEKTGRFQRRSSRYDAVLRGQAQLTSDEQQGLTLFQDPTKGNCVACHAGDRLSDDSWWNLGVPRNPRIAANADPAYFDLGLCRQPNLAAVAPYQYDIQQVCGFFRTPTLRNVAQTAPYMHNGVFATLRDAVRFHVMRDTNPELWYPAGQSYDDVPAANAGNVVKTVAPFDRGAGQLPRLSEAEIDLVIAFLRTLSDR